MTGRRTEKACNESLAYELCYDPTFELTPYHDTHDPTVAIATRGNQASREYWEDVAASLRVSPPRFDRVIAVLESLRMNILRNGHRGEMAVAAEILDIEFIRRRIEMSGARTLLPIYKVVATLVPMFRRYQAQFRDATFSALWNALRARVEAKLRVTSSATTSAASKSIIISRAVAEAVEQYSVAKEAVSNAIPELVPIFSSNTPAKRNTPASAPSKMARTMPPPALQRELDANTKVAFERLTSPEDISDEALICELLEFSIKQVDILFVDLGNARLRNIAKVIMEHGPEYHKGKLEVLITNDTCFFSSASHISFLSHRTASMRGASSPTATSGS